MVIAALIGYLIGSIPTAVLVGKSHKLDPRTRGDGNPGWWNMRGLVGERAALIVLFGDAAKGALAAGIGTFIWGPWWTPYVALFFAMLGHAYPLFARMRGGRSVVTWLGGMMVLAPIPVLLALFTAGAYLLVSRHLIYAARFSVFSVPVFQAFFYPAPQVAATAILMGFIALRFLWANSPAMDQSVAQSS